MTLLPDLGPHSTFIWAAYAVVFVTLTCLAAWIMADEQRQRRLLTELEARGARRRSAAKPQSPAAPDAPANASKPRAPAKSRKTASARKPQPPSAPQDKP